MKLFIVASNTSRTALVIAGSKPEAVKIAKKERSMEDPIAYDYIEYFLDEEKYCEETGKGYVWKWTEEKENE